MDCDGPKHALIRDADGSFSGSSPALGSIVARAELRYTILLFQKFSLKFLVVTIIHAGSTTTAHVFL